MSVMTAIKQFFAPKNLTPILADTNPMRIKLGSLVGMDDSFRLMAEGSTQVRGLGRNNTVFAKGEIDLGEGYKLHRFYFDDEDLMLQIRTSSYEDNFVEEIILFNYLSLINISTQRELERLAGRDSAIGLPTYKLEGVTCLLYTSPSPRDS